MGDPQNGWFIVENTQQKLMQKWGSTMTWETSRFSLVELEDMNMISQCCSSQDGRLHLFNGNFRI